MTERDLELKDVVLDGWCIAYERFEPNAEPTREALCTLGNGRFATRGCAFEVMEASAIHYPGTYAAGVYDRLSAQVDGKCVEYEELVNLPNWLPVRFAPAGDAPWVMTELELLSFRQVLDVETGVLTREMRVRDRAGRCTRIHEQRLVHMEHTHLAALRITLAPEDWAGEVEVQSWIDGRVENTNADEYEGLDRRHWTEVQAHTGPSGCVALRARTRQSRIEIALATRTSVRASEEAHLTPLYEDRRVGTGCRVSCSPTVCITVEKVVGLYTSRDDTCEEPLESALREVEAAPTFEALLQSQARAWEGRWARFAIELPELPRATTALRVHAFHILQTVSPAIAELETGIPARGLHGEGYHGHVFWDELFVFPILNLRWCDLTREILLYRYRRLVEARRAAHLQGLRGAAFPWRSASDGREVTDRFRRNPRSGRWIADHSHLQRHINAAIAYNVWQYFRATDDREFLINHGAELLLSTAQYWSRAAEFDQGDGRYHLRGVVGPDEFHDAYPDSERPGIDDNAYTNVMAVWSLLRAEDVLALLPAPDRDLLLDRLGIDRAERDRWREITLKMKVPMLRDGVIEQFHGFDQLQDFDWKEYERRYEDIHRLDNILEAEGDSPNRYQVCKQADVLMLFYLLPEAELRDLLARLGYPFDQGAYARTVHHYLARTSHGSTLSRVVHASVLTRLDRAHSWAVLRSALGSDLADIQDGSTGEGVHIGAMAGTLDILQRAYLGLELRDNELALDPQLPPEVGRLRVRARYRAQEVDIELTPDEVRVCARDSSGGTIALRIAEVPYELRPGAQIVARLDPC